MGHHHTKYETISVRLYDIKKYYDRHLLLKCQPHDLILSCDNKNYYKICNQLKIDYTYQFTYYNYVDCYIIHNLVSEVI